MSETDVRLGKAVHRVLCPVTYSRGKWSYREELRDVKVLAVSGAWAMVRRPRAVPYVAPIAELRYSHNG